MGKGTKLNFYGENMELNINVILGPSIVDGDIFRFISTSNESGVIETWDYENEFWIKVYEFENDIKPDDIAKGELIDDNEFESLTTERKNQRFLQTYNAKKHVESGSFEALSCFAEASKLEEDYKVTSYHLDCEHFLILFRGNKALHRKVFELILNELKEDTNEERLIRFYGDQNCCKNNERIDKVVKGPLLVKEKKKIIRVIEELPQKIKRLDIFKNNDFRPVVDEDNISWYDLRDAEKLSLTEFYDIVRPPIGFIHSGS